MEISQALPSESESGQDLDRWPNRAPQSSTGFQKGQKLVVLTQEMGWSCEEEQASNAHALDLGKELLREEQSQGVGIGRLGGRRAWSPPFS